MIYLADGPGMGEYETHRAPSFLRFVTNPFDGGRYILDLIEDQPEPDELVSVYQKHGGPAMICDRSRRNGKGLTVWVEYRWLPDVDGEQLRDTDRWQAWVIGELT